MFNSLVCTRKHRISGLVVEYIVAIDVTRARFPADAYVQPRLVPAASGASRAEGRADILRGARIVALRRWVHRSVVRGATTDQQVLGTLGLLQCADGSIAQWLERLTADQQVPGSNPGWPFARFTQVGRLSGAAQF